MRTRDEKEHLLDYWVIDRCDDREALALAARDGRIGAAHSWLISPVNHEFRPSEGGWKEN
ncbi:MAG: hypothetical protein QF376_04730 [Anaerolineales bacterium]|nr:hypothetical protein [Anaerolineales bacterium]